ncbi:hypothetical protein ANCCAN_19965 [Ancylostoma caninum]|uniref:Phlebovirus glycoprotein G2 fusion domain-containing protein n=1 Tax=Ancylostoma caninum TaxID=29170 RepID=A0A368FTR9_ANCCA|nr:hypothetical protein ANCCAN_19965 [Ancylostoma caninum]
MASILKVNPFKRNACIRLQRNDSTIMEARVYWDKLRLLCDKSSLAYSRNVAQKVIDSKRCPHMGSCKGNKCADVNSTSLLPELSGGNIYPGNTRCMESCGGPGCDCFYLSSGCLFYRIFAVPTDDKIYEIFTCARWKEQVKLRVQIRRSNSHTFHTYVLAFHPNVPVQLTNMSLTLSVLSVPPLPGLDTHFITTGNTTALWKKESVTLLHCTSWRHARDLQCNLHDTCDCSAAESQVSCSCKESDLSFPFKDIANVLPATRPPVRFLPHPRYAVTAQVDQGVSAELILNMKELIDESITDVLNDDCTVDDTHIVGCYRCTKGATAEVRCISATQPITAEVDCGTESFAIRCSPSGEVSHLHFLLPSAQTQMNCSVKCGSRQTSFEITGILKYVHNIHDGIWHGVHQQHNYTLDFQWPDISHMFSIYMQWYKMVIVTVAAVAGALLLTYLYLTTACGRLLRLIFRIIAKTAECAWKLVKCMIISISLHVFGDIFGRMKEKTTEKQL